MDLIGVPLNLNVYLNTDGYESLSSIAVVEEYTLDRYKGEEISYYLTNIELTRSDFSMIEVDQDDMDMLLEEEDKQHLYNEISGICRGSR